MWKKPFRRGSAEYGEAGLSYINMLRQKAVDPIKPLEKIFEAETNGEVHKAILRLPLRPHGSAAEDTGLYRKARGKGTLGSCRRDSSDMGKFVGYIRSDL